MALCTLTCFLKSMSAKALPPLLWICLAAMLCIPVKAASKCSPPIRIVTSISPLSDIVANIGGRKVSVAHFVPLNVDPHTYEPTFSSLAAVSQAQIIFLNGDGLDKTARQNLSALKNRKCTVIDLSTSIDEKAKNGIDPHYWLDPHLAENYVNAIADTLSRFDPSGAPYFQKNAALYKSKLEALDDRYRLACAGLPPSCKNIVLYHNAWTYLCTRYGFNIVGIIETGGVREPSARHLAQLIKSARRQRAGTILSEPGHGNKLLATVKAEAGIPVVLPMVEDSLLQSPYDTYLGMMQANLSRLSTACRSDNGSASGENIDEQNDGRKHQQQVNQASANVPYKTQQPQSH